MEEQNKIRPLALGLTVLTGFARLVPHVPNFTPVGAMSLFAGARLAGWRAYLVPLVMMLITDPILGAMYGYHAYSRVSPFIYASFMINVLLGRLLLAHSEKPARIGATALLCSSQFFLVSNFGVWAGSTVYAHTFSGLVDCYVAAIPFFGSTLAGDLVYTAVLFGLYAFLRKAEPLSMRTV